MVRLDKFSAKYGFFLSDATNEEIVSISKELSDEMARQTKSLLSTALALLGISVLSLFLSLLFLASVSSTAVASGFKNIIFFSRIGAVIFMVLAIATSAVAVTRALRASSISPMMWRNVRETADDEKVYEQTLAINELNKIIYKGKNSVRVASLFIFISAAAIVVGIVVELFISAGYL